MFFRTLWYKKVPEAEPEFEYGCTGNILILLERHCRGDVEVFEGFAGRRLEWMEENDFYDTLWPFDLWPIDEDKPRIKQVAERRRKKDYRAGG